MRVLFALLVACCVCGAHAAPWGVDACDNSSFPVNLNNVQVMGLNQVRNPAANAQHCALRVAGSHGWHRRRLLLVTNFALMKSTLKAQVEIGALRQRAAPATLLASGRRAWLEPQPLPSSPCSLSPS